MPVLRSSPPAPWIVAVAAVILVLSAPAQASGQSWLRSWEDTEQRKHLAANAALGGTAAGIAASFRGEPFVPAFWRGAGGGGLAYVGKWVAVHRATGAGLLGQQITSVGSSITGNVVAGRGSFDRVALSVGPVRAYVGREVDGVRWKLDVPALGAAVWTAVDGGRLHLRESLSRGAFVFASDRNYGLPGTISYQTLEGSRVPRDGEALPHEQVHVLQWDQSFLSLGAPMEDWLATRFPRFGRPLGRLDFNLPALFTVPLLAATGASVWEGEAFLLGYLGRSR